MPNRPRPGTSVHTYRADDDLYRAAREKAARLGTTVAEVVVEALRRFVDGR